MKIGRLPALVGLAIFVCVATGLFFSLNSPSKAQAIRDLDAYWVGSGPFCHGQASDCTNRPSYYYWFDNDAGDGSACFSGHKVLCVNRPYTHYKHFKWIGTSPACGGDPSDCTKIGMEFITRGTTGDGAGCSSGKKVLCASP